MNIDPLIQDSLSDNREIILRIKAELSKAESEILVAMAWFTNDDLLDILINKAKAGVNISVIVAENTDNEKLDFDGLDQFPTANVIKIKNVGYGIMNQKFCVIDRKLVISGSYNWSKNAKNNHESVIVTAFPKTVEEFVTTFFSIKEKAVEILTGNPSTTNPTIVVKDIQVAKPVLLSRKISFHEQSLIDFKSVLDNIIATEVGSLDREYIRTSAYNRAKENNGDHQILPQAMDSLYSNFINEIEVISEKKVRLKGKIEEQLKLNLGNIELNTENEISSQKEFTTLEQRNLEENLHQTEKELETARIKIQNNLETKIPYLNDQIEKVRLQINEEKIEFVKPPINWTKTIVLSLLLALLIGYVFVFYSSVAYIFMFAKEDFVQAIARGTEMSEPQEVFNAQAISRIWHKGNGGILFLFLFVSIPLGLGMFSYISETIEDKKVNTEQNKLAQKIHSLINQFGGIVLILIVDIFIAYKVAVNINQVQQISRIAQGDLTFSQIIFNGNFWLVFILGTLGVILFSKVFNKLMTAVNNRNLSHQQAVVKQKVANMKSNIEQFEQEINKINVENDELRSTVSILKSELQSIHARIQNSPILLEEKLKDLKLLMISYNEKIINLSNIYKSQIDNDKLPLSRPEMENRCNIFMEGWSKYLYEFYAISIAEIKTRDAISEVETWLNMLIVTPEISKELNLNSLASSN